MTLVELITIGLSTYMILYSHWLYGKLENWLKFFERLPPHRERELGESAGPGKPVELILFGLGRYGSSMAGDLSERGVQVLGVDFDPETVKDWGRKGLATRYGDAEDPEFPSSLPLPAARWVVCSIAGRGVNQALLQALRQHGYTGRVALTAHASGEAERLQQAGADLVLLPFRDAAREAVDLLTGEETSRWQEPNS